MSLTISKFDQVLYRTNHHMRSNSLIYFLVESSIGESVAYGSQQIQANHFNFHPSYILSLQLSEQVRNLSQSRLT